MRVLLIALAALTVSACNQVYSRTPLLGEAPAQPGDPELRAGLWQVGALKDERCPFDIRQPTNRWPDCAVALEYKGGQFWEITPHERRLALVVKLVGGDPVLMQEHWRAEILADPRAPEPADSDNPFSGWTYASLTVVRTDGLGRIMEAQMLNPVCGPTASGKPVAEQPFPGLTMVKSNCVAADLDAVRGALARTKALPPPEGAPTLLRWVRDYP